MDFLSLIPHTLKGLAMFSEKKSTFCSAFPKVRIIFLVFLSFKILQDIWWYLLFFVLQILFVQIR